MNNRRYYFLPPLWEEITDKTEFYGWDFLKPLIGKKIFWGSVDWHTMDRDLPKGYEFYLIKVEGPNTEWIEKQSQLVEGKLIVMCLPSDYNLYANHKNIIFLPCVEWHYQFQSMIATFDSTVRKNIQRKVSVLTNRVNYNKLIALSAVLKNLPADEIFYSLHDWVESKNVHNWGDTCSPLVNQYKNLFVENFNQWRYKPDGTSDLSEVDTYNFHYFAFQNCAINITNESWNFSLRHNQVLPGPFITEKTLKCLLGETAFLANGQFDTYRTLEQFGFKFDYGIDLSYDSQVGDITRLEGLINVIESLKHIDTTDLFLETRESCLHNKQWILSGEFYKKAEEFNTASLNRLLTIVS